MLIDNSKTYLGIIYIKVVARTTLQQKDMYMFSTTTLSF
ncbi:hypothetical protein C427_1907 [Paraglaciecola psychrophila 170]|uniref:Uncharacterized protein n=1 Tax=Paraglaciecola psychrophila 170 TaxID=1129794 RepID=M4RKD1_9ALTE|nr:hypothetical protein C427_1907 [Paraglaciecola psychrophila 170]